MTEEIAKIAVYGEDNSITKEKNRKIINDLLKITLNRKFNIQIFNHNINECVKREVDINIFIGTINPSFIHLSKLNVFFCDLPKFNKKWRPYLKYMDNVICKNKYSYNIMCDLVPKNSVFLWNWYSDDMRQLTTKKTHDSILLVANHLDFHNVQLVLDIWDISWPQLIVYYDSKKTKFETDKENILLINEAITPTEYKTMINYYKKQIYFTSGSEWNYILYEAYSCEANVLCIKNDMNTYTVFNEKLYIDKFKNEKYKNKYGVKCVLDKDSLIDKIENFISISIIDSNRIGKNNRQLYLQNKRDSRKKFEGFFSKMIDLSEEYSKLSIPTKMIDTDLCEIDNLPKVSIILFYNGEKDIVDKIIRYNINNTLYPKDKLQLVIGTHRDVNLELDVKYKVVKFEDEKMKLGERYNVCLGACKNDYIVMMHDDCIYYPNSIYNRVYSLLYKDIQCSFSTNKHYYDICEKKHYFTTEPLNREYFNRCHPFSLAFKKHFWKKNNFLKEWNTYNDVMFIKDRYDRCVEINSFYIGISILHKTNRYVKNLKVYSQNESKLGIRELDHLDKMEFVINEKSGLYVKKEEIIDVVNKNENESVKETETESVNENDVVNENDLVNETETETESVKETEKLDSKKEKSKEHKINKEFYSKYDQSTKYTEKNTNTKDYLDYSNVNEEDFYED